MRRELLAKLWTIQGSLKLSTDNSEFEPFFKYYTKQCRHALHDGARHTFVRNHEDVVEIAEDIKMGHSREELISKLSAQLKEPKLAKEPEMLNSSVDLAARLISMMDIGCLQYGFSGRPHLEWGSGSFKNFVHEYFRVHIVLGHENIKLEKMFNARNLSRIAGIVIVWTDNIADHLRIIDDEDKKVAIFHHASFLKYQRE